MKVKSSSDMVDAIDAAPKYMWIDNDLTYWVNPVAIYMQHA